MVYVFCVLLIDLCAALTRASENRVRAPNLLNGWSAAVLFFSIRPLAVLRTSRASVPLNDQFCAGRADVLCQRSF